MELFKKIINKVKADKNVFINTNCTEFEVNNWVISQFVLKKLIPIVGIHPFPLSELSLLVSSVCWYKPTHIFEWGTHIGKSARTFYETCKYFGIETEIHSIDLPDDITHVEHPHNKRGKLVKGKANVFLHQGDGLNTSLEILKSVSKDARPLFYVDGDHSYESVCRELRGILTNANNPQIILHDTFFQSEESGYNIGPYQAIIDVLNEFPDKAFKKITLNTGLPGMTLLYT